MPETIVSPAAPAAPLTPVVVQPPGVENAPAAPLAGKYASVEELQKGIREASSKLGLLAPPDGELVGDGKTFKDVASAEAYYKNIQKMISAGRPAPAATPPGAPVEPLKIGGDALPEDAPPEAVLQRAGLTMEEIGTQWRKSGALTDDQYAKIQAADSRLSKLAPTAARSIINQTIKGEVSTAELTNMRRSAVQAEAAQIVGGVEQLQTLLREAQTFVPAADRAGFDKLLDNASTMTAAVRTLKQMQAEHNKTAGSGSIASGSIPSGSSGPKTVREYLALEKRAVSGDKAAMAVVQSMTGQDIANLK